MPHEFLGYPRDSIEGILLSQELLVHHKEQENQVQEREINKNPKLQKGEQRSRRVSKQNPSRMKNMKKKR